MESHAHESPTDEAAKIRRPSAPQPLDAARTNEALLKLRTVNALVGLEKSAVYERIAAGSFPEPIRLSARCSRWRAGDVMAWLNAQGQ